MEDGASMAGATMCSWFAGVVLTNGLLIPIGILSGLPASLALIDGGLTMLLIGGTKLGVRLLSYSSEGNGVPRKGKRVLVAGAGSAGSMVVKEFRANPQLGAHVIGFL